MKKLFPPILLVVAGMLLMGLSFFETGKSGKIDMEIVKTPIVMPAAHKVYGNPEALGGKYYLFKSKITNNRSNALEDVVIRYRIPGLVEWTELETVGEMLPGQSAVVTCYPKFEKNVTEKTTESIETAEIEIDWRGASDDDLIEESFSFKMLSRNDFAYTSIPSDEVAGWSDMFDNDELVACFVTPSDPVVKYYTQIIQEKVLKGEAAGISQNPEMAVKFMMGLYDATLMSHMVYSSTKGIPQSLDDVQTMVQHVRLPREVITGNTGLCIELSTLYASVMSAAGIDPVIFMIPGHAYPGFRMNGQYYAIEATGIGGEGLGNIANSQEALKAGMKQLDEFIKMTQMGDPRYNLVDIHGVNSQGVTSMDLADNDFLRKKVDDIAKNFSTSREANRYTVSNTTPNSTSSRRPSDTSSSTARYPGPLSFTIPSGWQTYSRPSPQMPVLTAQVASPDMMANVSVFDIPASDPGSAMNVLNQYFYNLGMELQYSDEGGYIAGKTYSTNGTFTWKGKMAPIQGGYRFVAVGANDMVYSQYSGMINRVFNSIK
ncbi:hypothetical protein AB9P05_17785 [Roseivirga sp. BDSF3-8]|uniref:hypothetical protein n=1 Tax=Roseivirga sp. BDSF3-8 TaxID=3241598 RepID=UPI003531E00A